MNNGGARCNVAWTDPIVKLIIVVIFCNLVGVVSSVIKSDTPHLEETAQHSLPSITENYMENDVLYLTMIEVSVLNVLIRV